MYRSPLFVAAIILAGCAQQPVWISTPPKVLCFEHADRGCLSELIAQKVGAEQPGHNQLKSFRYARAVMASAGIDEPSSLSLLIADFEKVMCIRPDTDFVLAGQEVQRAKLKNFDLAISNALVIHDEDAKLFALLHIATLASRANDEGAIGKTLSILNHEDRAAYMEALQSRLVTLLAIGDLERAKSLQELLLSYYTASPDNTMAIARVAISYVTAGHVADANEFLRGASSQVPELRTEDVARLLSIMVNAAKGEHPSPQDFYDFSSDEMRLQAYVQLALFYERSGNLGLSRKTSSDLSRFVQKSSLKVGHAATAQALSRVLIETY